MIVQKIYRLFMCGMTAYAIASQLTAEGIPTPGGKQRWRSTTINSILTNEKYKGDALLHRTRKPTSRNMMDMSPGMSR